MTLSPQVSVIVPYFQSEKYFERCLQALAAQQPIDGGWELLLVDNGSRDASRRIAQRFEASAPIPVRLLHEEEPGAYAARNAALRTARGVIVAFTDADCVSDPDWLRQLVRWVQEPDVGVVVGHCRYPAEASPLLRLLARYENEKARWVAGAAPAYRFAYANNMAVLRSRFEEVGLFEPWRRAGDTEFVHRLHRHRPELRLAFAAPMRVTHLEFTRSRDRLRRLGRYTETNARIDTFEELPRTVRWRLLVRALVGR